ncbi:hypothetical protein F511_26271 [Dorcoceras hygrometricum]|uniref:Uncharacterized protein n=1 Tax=Dorcoceras hygrometricum TaxID=472368 RepID=A0A2Z7CGD4_9LAMI|nr:hypothetical protein F511_26271 [Dorcoceras hygrometricum]
MASNQLNQTTSQRDTSPRYQQLNKTTHQISQQLMSIITNSWYKALHSKRCRSNLSKRHIFATLYKTR